MDSDGTKDTRGTRRHGVPRPSAPPGGTGHEAGPPTPGPAAYPAAPALPPRPGHKPGEGRAAPGADPGGLLSWLLAPRAAAEPGLWRYGYRPRPQDAPDRVSDRALLTGAVGALLAALLVWSLWANNLVPHKNILLELVTPSEWWTPLSEPREALTARAVYDSLFATLVLYYFGRVGNWKEVAQRYVISRPQPSRALRAAVVGALVVWLVVWRELLPYERLAVSLTPSDWLFGPTDVSTVHRLRVFNTLLTLLGLWPFAVAGDWRRLLRGVRRPEPGAETAAEAVAETPADWPELRALGQNAAADRLAEEARTGRMNDVDCARIRRAWASVVAHPSRLDAFASAVLHEGARACAHPSGERDLPARTAVHDLLTSQVRIGRYAVAERTPPARRDVGAAVDPGTLGTSLLAVGPSGAGKTERLVRPVAESLALQALAGQAALVVVSAAGTPLGADQGYDIVVRPGDQASVYDLDLYGGAEDPDEAAALLADTLVGDLGEVDLRRAGTVLAQLLGPFRAAHGRFPSVGELRELLDGVPSAMDGLRALLDPGTHPALHRELDARARQAGVPGDPGVVLADRIACLDRPAFEGFFDTSPDARPFSLRALDHPLRVRIDLPERAHPEASRLLTRLLLVQFTAAMTARQDRSLFACLVLDDATQAITAESVRSLRRVSRCSPPSAAMSPSPASPPGKAPCSPRCGAPSGWRPPRSPSTRCSRTSR